MARSCYGLGMDEQNRWPDWAIELSRTDEGAKALNGDVLLRACAESRLTGAQAILAVTKDRQRLLALATQSAMGDVVIVEPHIDKDPVCA